MIWRDDDISVETRGARLVHLQAVDDLFQQYRVTHTVAVIAEGLETNPRVAQVVRARRMVPQLHGWTHADLTTDPEAVAALPRAVELLTRVFGHRPTLLYPPWNKSNASVDAAAAALGLRVSTEKLSLEQYLRAGGDVREDTVNFHYWHPPDVAQLAAALRVYRLRHPR